MGVRLHPEAKPCLAYILCTRRYTLLTKPNRPRISGLKQTLPLTSTTRQRGRCQGQSPFHIQRSIPERRIRQGILL